jgi:poly(3-hydroxybutyrate) depolymerase
MLHPCIDYEFMEQQCVEPTFHFSSQQTRVGCRDGADVTLCMIVGGGHTWPGRAEPPRFCQNKPKGRLCKRWQETVGEVNRDISANELMWDFFFAHPMPSQEDAPEP